MKSLLFFLIATALAAVASAAPEEVEFMKHARYSYTSMSDNGDIMQSFICSDGRSFSVYYTDREGGNRIVVERSGEQKVQIEARENPDALANLRTILSSYLKSPGKNRGATIDVMAALLLVNEPTLRVHDIQWQGASRG